MKKLLIKNKKNQIKPRWYTKTYLQYERMLYEGVKKKISGNDGCAAAGARKIYKIIINLYF